MATPVQQALVPPTADVVGNAFVHQYYLILHQSPELVHRFYQDMSKLGRPEVNGVMSITTTMQAIDEKILSLQYEEIRAEITTVDAQESHKGGVLVLVTGYLTGKDDVRRKFTQSFFLAPQDNGYFVLNDVFRYVDDEKHQSEKQGSLSDAKVPSTPDKDPAPLQENHISEQPAVSSEEVSEEEVYNPSENGDDQIEEVEAPEPQAIDEVPNDKQMISESKAKIEEVPKKSYASIVKVMKDSGLPLSTPIPSPMRSSLKSQELQATAAPAPATVSEIPVSSANAIENGNNQEGEVEGPSIYLKGLPMNITYALIENEFKKFGTIRSGGIQIKSQKGFTFGFVEFDEASAVHSAIEASPVMVGGRRVTVEEKKSTSRGNRGRSSSGTGNGYRNDGGRGRGGYGGGRGFGRGDFDNRSEFGMNRNFGRVGFSNRGGDRYQRDHYTGNGGRVNRAGGYNVNAADKAVTQQVSAPA
ncbi:RRM_1 domain-containing protein/NTF2 domain-containing protein [Cephalotus follicularis]|uniref:RRM_1 domain-containing protein/NTF2 domain-containing protein n=1 Tax=Cephalotus follicularis TaxID=3775 RepID=A0A1Q3BSI2_CEPFO|nr:RRM_1 domain-containing protein/NTF2 domain-containing protein [Cephalotus follicularis]